MSARAIPILGEGVAEGGEGVPEGIAAGNVDLTHLDSDEGDCKDLQVRLDASGVQADDAAARLEDAWLEFFEARARRPLHFSAPSGVAFGRLADGR